MTSNAETVTFSIDRLQAGTTLPGPSTEDEDGSVLLLQAGVCVSAEQIDHLRNRGITQIRIEKRFADSLISLRSTQRAPAPIVCAPSGQQKSPPIARPGATVTWSSQVSRTVGKLREAQSERLTQVYSLLENQGPLNPEVLSDIGMSGSASSPWIWISS